MAAPSIGRSILAGTILGLIAVSAVALVIHAQFRERDSMHAKAIGSQEVSRGLQGVLSLAQGVEFGPRGYAISGNEEFLDAYRVAARRLPERVRTLNAITLPDAEQRDLVAALDRHVQALLANAQRIVAAQRAEAAPAGAVLAGTRRGMTVMADIRRVVERISERETAHAEAALDRSLDRSNRRFGYLAALLLTVAVIVAAAPVVASRTWRRCADAEAALRIALMRLRAIFDGTMEGLVIINRSGLIATMNASARGMLRLPEDSAEPQHVRKFLAPKPGRKDGIVVSLRDLMGTVGEVTEVWLRRTDRTVFPANVSLNEINLDGRQMFVAAIRDISERHRFERMKGEFVATVSHELRTPLTSISGSLGLIAGGAAGPLSEKAARLIAIAQANSERLVRLVNDILDTEKLKSGCVDLKNQPVEVCQLVASVVEANRDLGESSGVSIRMLDAPARLFVLGDVEHLTRLVTNLLSNAVKFSPVGGTVTFAVAERPDTVVIRVSDEGPGIPEDFRDRLFERFSQADSSATRVAGGSGLGLSIVKGIVDGHDGAVSVHCPAEGGSEFEVRLPLHEAERPGPAGSATDHPARILLCEDEADTASVFRAALEEAGFAVSVAATADAALDQLHSRSFSAALIDLSLPDRHGFDLVHDLRNDLATHDLPVLVVTKHRAGARLAGEAAALNVLDWIEKPVAPEQVVARLKRAMLALADTLPLALHLDDDADVRSIVAEALSGTARLLQAASVEEAQRILAREPVDAIILDPYVNGGTGLDILPHAVDREGQPIPVVVFSNEDADAEVVAKVAAALTKSRVSLDELVERVGGLIRRHRAAAPRLEGRG